MKPRPMFSTFLIPTRCTGTFAALQYRNNPQLRAIAPALSCQRWQDGLRGVQQEHEKIWISNGRRYASTATTPAKKLGNRTAMAPSTSAKATKTTVPMKTTSNSTHPRSPLPTVPARTLPSKYTTVPTLQAKAKLNPPDFTYAPELSVPTRIPDQNFVGWLWKAGRSYLTFYKQGISNVRQTSKLAKVLRTKAAKSPGKETSEVLTRAEWQIVRRSKRDTLRLPVFGFLVLLLGEWLPLVVLWLTPVIPEACRIPKQVQRALTKLESKRQDRVLRAGLNTIRLMSKDGGFADPANVDAIASSKASSAKPAPKSNDSWKNMPLFALVMFSAQHDCHLRVFDWLHITPPKWLLQRNVRKKMQYLNTDDALIERDGGWAGLNKEELQRACVERGISVLGKQEEEMRRSLHSAWKGA